jgi:subtilisin family serine protease
MRALGRSLALGLAALFAAAGLAAAQSADRPGPAAPDPARQVLVMLRAPPQHARPNASYGGAYGDGEARAARLRIAIGLARAYGLALVSEWPMPLLGVDCFVMAVPEGESADEAAERIGRDPGVSWSEPMHTYRAQDGPLTHNDPLFRAQPAAGEWRLAELHQISTGRNVRVAVIDSMIEASHPDLAGQVEVSQNFVSGHANAPEQHGTGVAGIIAARSDNGLGIAGVAPSARLMGLRACWQETARTTTICDSLSLAKALDYAITHNAQVINLSLSGPPDVLLGKLLDVALARGLVVVGAFDRNARGGGFPASHQGVVAVVDQSKGPPTAGAFSAPGRGVPTTQPGGRWFLVDGSSYAAAHVSGLFALLRERTRTVRSSSALVLAEPSDTIDACATLLRFSGPCNCSCSRPHEVLAAFPE